ncbi:MAG: hypothetical protein ACQ9MH_10840 [Nitrospinales bacterium]
MIFDENEDGEIIDIEYVHDEPITRYKLVCENDVDVSSLGLSDQNIMNEYIEMGLVSKKRRTVFSEVVSLLHNYKLRLEGRLPENDFEVLMHRIISLSGEDGRPLEVVIDEHLVGTTDADPAIKK